MRHEERFTSHAPTPARRPLLAHTFTAPGTYFAVLRVTAHREGDADETFTRVQNLDRVRVVVR